MTNQELYGELAKRKGLTKKKAREVVQELVSIIRGEVQGEGRFRLSDLGVFTLRYREPRVVKGAGGQVYQVPARQAVCFKVAANWKRAVNLR
jgi:nucleoid DNA-binding protein